MLKQRALRNAIAAALLGAATLALAQTPDSGEPKRGNTPPGLSRDGSGPSDGAILGGSVRKPGETRSPERDIARCHELRGRLRDECLADLGIASTPEPLEPTRHDEPSERELEVDPQMEIA